MTAEAKQAGLMTGNGRFARLLKLAALAVAVGAAGAAAAASYTNSATGNWDADASWTGAKPSAGGAADAEVVFSGAGALASTNNLAGTFLMNRMEFAAGATTLWGSALAFTNNGATGPQIVNSSAGAALVGNALTLGSDTTINTLNNITLCGGVGGKGGLIKTGAGTLTLTNVTTYTGATLISAGKLTVYPSASTSSACTNYTIQSGATMQAVAYSNINFWVGVDKSVVNVQGNGTLTIDCPALKCGYLNAVGGATVNGCPLLIGTNTASLNTALLGSVNFARIILEPVNSGTPTQTLQFDGTGTGLKIGTDSGTAFSWRPGSATGLQTVKMDIGDSPSAAVDLLVPWLNLRPGNGGIAFYKQGAGSMQVNGLDWASAGSPIKPTSCTVNGGSLILNTSATNTFGVNFASATVDSGATLQLGTNGNAGVLFVNVTDNGTLAFNRANAYTFTNEISGSGSVVQKGSGTLTLTGANTYSGGTTVSAGTLQVSSSGTLGSGTVSVLAGGTLSGSGTLSAPVQISAGGTLTPAGTNAVGTLTLSNAGAGALTLSGASLLCDLSNVAGSCDQIPIAGTLVLNGANTIALSFPSGTPPAGTYTLMTYAGKSGSGTLALNAFYPNATLSVTDSNAVLTVTGAGLTYLKWKGAVSGTWDTTTQNWLREGLPSAYSEGDAVLFDDTAASNFVISAAGALSPSSVTFNNSATNYSLAAGVTGAGAYLVKQGAFKATLTGTNTYGAGTVLAGGTLSVGAFTNLPSGGPLTFNGGTLQITGTAFNSLTPYAVNWDSFKGGLDIGSGNTITVTNAIGGSGGLTKSGSGVLVLSGTNTYGGGTTVNSGTLRITTSSGIGSGAVNMAGSNEQLDLMGGLNPTNAITVRGDGAGNSAGSLQSYTGTSNAWSGPITLGDSNARIGAPRGVLAVNGVIASGANTYDLIIRNPNTDGGTIILAATNAYRGSTWIRCGTIKLGINNALPVSAVLQLGMDATGQSNVTNSTFDLAGFNQQVAGLVDRGTENAHLITNSAAEFSTLTVTNASTAYSYAGVLAGNLNVLKAGAGTLTIVGTNTLAGCFTISNGTLAVSGGGTLGENSTNILVAAGTLSLSNLVGSAIADTAAVRIANGGGAKVNLAAGVSEAVGYLYFGDKQRPGGTYGAAGSGAGVIDGEHFSGSGILRVLHGNGGVMIVIR